MTKRAAILCLMFISIIALGEHATESGGRASAPAKPVKPVTLPATSVKIKDAKINEYGNEYLEHVKNLEKKLSDPALPNDWKNRASQEIRLSKALANSEGKFVGYSEIPDKNERAIVNLAGVKDSLRTVERLMHDAKMAEILMVQTDLRRIDDEYPIFIRPQIEKAYPNSESALRDLETWAVELNNWHRNNGK